MTRAALAVHAAILLAFCGVAAAGGPLPPGGGNSGPTNSNARAAPLLGTIGVTTVAGSDPFATWLSFPVGTTIAGPFEAGFNSEIDTLLSWLGCTPASGGYLAGGIDTQTSLEVLQRSCGVTLPKIVNNTFVSLMYSGGVHSPPDTNGCTSPPGSLSGYTACSSPGYHYHQNFTNLYNVSAPGHSTKVGVTSPSSSTVTARGIYGKYESTGTPPTDLDACGGHFGTTPDSATSVYHHHVQDRAPFAVGCYGPSETGGLVSLAECRSYYSSTCGDGTVNLTSTRNGVTTTFAYDPYCPCYDSTGSNVLGSTTTSPPPSPPPIYKNAAPTWAAAGAVSLAAAGVAILLLA